MPKIPFWLRCITDTTNPGGDGNQPPPGDTPPTDQPPGTSKADAKPGPETPPKDQESPPLGDAGKKALSEERKARRDAEKALAAAQAKVKEFEQRDLSDNERMTQQLADATQRAEHAETDALRLRIAAETGLDPDLHEFLDGITDEDQMRARAQKLAAKAAAANPKKPDFGGGRRGDDPTSLASLDQRIAEAVKAGDLRQSIALKRQRQAMVNAAK